MGLIVELDHDRGVPVYRQIYEAVLTALSDGSLGKDEQLPTIHSLAGELEVNPNTVARAYRELESDGYITGKRGLGTFPTPGVQLPTKSKRAILREIFNQAVSDGARHRISQAEIVKYFQKAQQ